MSEACRAGDVDVARNRSRHPFRTDQLLPLPHALIDEQLPELQHIARLQEQAAATDREAGR